MTGSFSADELENAVVDTVTVLEELEALPHVKFDPEFVESLGCVGLEAINRALRSGPASAESLRKCANALEACESFSTAERALIALFFRRCADGASPISRALMVLGAAIHKRCVAAALGRVEDEMRELRDATDNLAEAVELASDRKRAA